MRKMCSVLLLILLWFQKGVSFGGVWHHDLQVDLQPQRQYIKVLDKVTVPSGLASPEVEFYLHKNMVLSIAEIADIQTVETPSTALYTKYKIVIPQNISQLNFSYEGVIDHPTSEEMSPGTIASQGVSLLGGTYWFPQIYGEFYTFNLSVQAPTGWKVVSQGQRQQVSGQLTQWAEQTPQKTIFLIAAEFTEYSSTENNILVQVFLRTADDALAQTYLALSHQYIKRYSDLLGQYPYSKFALVENFWETGFGMPSFTLLGSSVIRLPFIQNSSYPHEILHNWWGNGVYVNYATGNWSEGLTSYLADHLLQADVGLDGAYRRAALKNYIDYVTDQNEFSVNQFLSRNSDFSSAIGYGKVMMIFHMLKNVMGEQEFYDGLKLFFQQNRFKVAGYQELRFAMEQIYGESLNDFFDAWTTRKGAINLELSKISNVRSGQFFEVNVDLAQVQTGLVLPAKIPLEFTFSDGTTRIFWEDFNDKNISMNYRFVKQPIRVSVDGNFDTFRRLDINEVPSTVSEVIATQLDKVLFLIPSAASQELQLAYRTFAEDVAKRFASGVEIKLDSEVSNLPADRAVWILGWQNIYISDVQQQLNQQNVDISADSVSITSENYLREESMMAMTYRNKLDPSKSIIWVGADHIQGLPVLARKIIHYGKYSVIGFDKSGTNKLKTQWPTVESPYIKTIRW